MGLGALQATSCFAMEERKQIFFSPSNICGSNSDQRGDLRRCSSRFALISGKKQTDSKQEVFIIKTSNQNPNSGKLNDCLTHQKWNRGPQITLGWKTRKQANVALNDPSWEQKRCFTVRAASVHGVMEVEGSGDMSQMQGRVGRKGEHGGGMKTLKESDGWKEEKQECGRAETPGGDRAEGGAEGRLSKNRTGHSAHIQPPISLHIFIFQSSCMSGFFFPNSEAELAGLFGDSCVWFPWKFNRRNVTARKSQICTPRGERWLPPWLF